MADQNQDNNSVQPHQISTRVPPQEASSPPQPQLHEVPPAAVEPSIPGPRASDDRSDPLFLRQHLKEGNNTELKELYPDAKRRKKVKEFYTRLVHLFSVYLGSYFLATYQGDVLYTVLVSWEVSGKQRTVPTGMG